MLEENIESRLEPDIRITQPTFKKEAGAVIPGSEHTYDELELLLGKVYFSMMPLKVGADMDRLDFKFASEHLNLMAIMYSIRTPQDTVDYHRRIGTLGDLAFDCHTTYTLVESLKEYIPFDPSKQELIINIKESIATIKESLLTVLERHRIADVSYECDRAVDVIKWYHPEKTFTDLAI